MKYTYDFPRPAVAADVVVFGVAPPALQILLIQRLHEPFKDAWALPGGFVDPDEDLATAARRELAEETGLNDLELIQLHAFGSPNRDPRGRVISIAHYGIVDVSTVCPQAASDAAVVKWFGLKRLPRLAFDHAEIIRLAIQHLRDRLSLGPLHRELLPRKFTMEQLRQTYETLLQRLLRGRKFKEAMLKTRILRPSQSSRASKPMTYSFDAHEYKRAMHGNWSFDLHAMYAPPKKMEA